MSHIFTKENITFALSIFGSLGTLFTLIHTFLINRKQLQMRVNGHVFGDVKKMIVLYVSFANKSRLPISVTLISIFYFLSTHFYLLDLLLLQISNPVSLH